jgi:hypothetical protein
LGPCRQQDDRDISGLISLTELLQDCEAVSLRHHDVEHDEVGSFHEGRLESGVPVGCLQDLVPVELKVHPAQQEHVGFVVDDQDAQWQLLLVR